MMGELGLGLSHFSCVGTGVVVMRERRSETGTKRPSIRRVKVFAVLAGALLLCAYFASYVWLSRAGFARADATDMERFYFVEPVSPDAYRAHRRLSIFYAAAITVERVLGTGRSVGKEPLWGLE